MPPTIIFVPGLWEGPKVFTKLTTLLQTQGYTTHIASLLSTGHTSPGKPSMNNDIAHIRSTISASVDAGEEVLLICHSAGGFLGSAAIQGLTLKARKEKELKGGVVKILFIAAGVFPLGSKPPQTPFYEFNGGALNCRNARSSLFHELSEAEADHWMAQLQPQPAFDWDQELTYCGWMEVPSVFLVCEADRLLPAELQVQLAGLAGSEVIKCSAGHMIQLSAPEKVVEIVKGVLEGL